MNARDHQTLHLYNEHERPSNITPINEHERPSNTLIQVITLIK